MLRWCHFLHMHNPQPLHAGLPAARAASAPASSLEAARRRLDSMLQAPERPRQPARAPGAGRPNPAGQPAGRKRPRCGLAGPGSMRSSDRADVPALPTPALEGRQPRASESA